MKNEEAVKDTQSNQNVFLTASFTLAGGGIIFLVSYVHDKSLTYSLIPLGLAMVSWFFSIFSGLLFIIKRGNNSGQAQSGEEVHIHPDYYKAPTYIRGQLILFILGSGFFAIWLVWHLISNTNN